MSELGLLYAKQAMGAAGTFPATLGQVATRCVPSIASLLPSNVQQMNSRSGHVMRATCSTIQVAFTNSWVSNPNGTTETGPGAPLVIANTFLEYPIGTFTRITWSGANSLSIPDAADGPLSDPVTAPPRGALFFVRTFATCTGGVIYAGFPAVAIDGSGGEFGTSGLTDKSGGGTISGQYYMSPVVIVGQTTRPSVYLFGDSIGAGLNDNIPDISNEYGLLARAIGPQFGYVNQCRSSEKLSQFLNTANGAKRIARAQMYASHILSEYGRNDFTGGATAAQHAANVTLLASKFPGKPFIQTTVTPFSASTVAISALSSSATTATATIPAPQAAALKVGQTIAVAGASPSGYNGTVVVTAISGQQISYTLPNSGSGLAAATTLGTMSDLWASTAFQTTANNDAERVKFNDMLRAGMIPGVTDFFDAAFAVETSLNSGIWQAALTNDGLHPLTAGQIAIRQARVIVPERVRLASIG